MVICAGEPVLNGVIIYCLEQEFSYGLFLAFWSNQNKVRAVITPHRRPPIIFPNAVRKGIIVKKGILSRIAAP